MFKLLLIIMLSVSFSACTATKTNEKNPASAVKKSLKTHQAQWKEAGLDKYSYEFRRSCFCMRDFTKPVLIKVKNNTVTDARFKDNHKPLTKEFSENKQTIDNLFEIIQKAIEHNAHSIKVEYNEQYGYPTSIAVDYDEKLADEELYLSAKDLKPL